MNTRKRILYKSILIIGVLFVLASVSFAWFHSSNKANVGSGMQTGIEDAYVLEISTDGGTSWVYADEFKISGGGSVKPVCGNGAKFFFPEEDYNVVTEGKNKYVSHGKLMFSDVSSDYKNYVFEQQFMVRSDYDCNIFLAGGGVNPGRDSAQSAVKKAGTDEYYSSGYICAASRVALFEKDSSGWQLLSVWMPNPTVCLSGDSEHGYTLNLEGEVEDSYVFPSAMKNTGEIQSALTIETTGEGGQKLDSGSKVVDGVLYGWGDISVLPPLGELSAASPRTFKLMLWIDGLDRECENVFQAGTLDFSFEIGSELITEEEGE